MTQDRKPRFTRVLWQDGMWLRDREAKGQLVGPFDSWAAALAYIKDAERGTVGEKEQER